MNEYLQGNVVTLSVEWSGEPDVVTAKVKDPANVESSLSVAGAGTTFTAQFDTTGKAPGVYTYQFRSTGDAVGLAEAKFRVSRRRIS